MARAAEKAAYETNAHSALLFHNVSIVMLTGAERLDEPQDSGEPTNDPSGQTMMIRKRPTPKGCIGCSFRTPILSKTKEYSELIQIWSQWLSYPN